MTDELEVKVESTDESDTASSDAESASSSSDSDDVKAKAEKRVYDGEEEKDRGVELIDIEEEERRREEKPVAKKRRLTKRERTEKTKEQRSKDKLGYRKPDIAADREKERALAHIATKGVTQLFNAVAERQKYLDEQVAAQQRSVRRPAVATTDVKHEA
ncbi:hypothetical protein AAVH_20547 [Aphelenchoides avenae]|nr:hypothetical protein AAVH_20547 [Aphelenchus avenae]